MVHIHVRTPDGKPSQDAELFRAAIREIRKRCDILVQVSTGGAVGMGVDERCGRSRLTGADRPDMATLSTGTVNFGEDVFWNPRPLVRDIAKRIRELGLKPEFECFDVGHDRRGARPGEGGLVDAPGALRLRARRARRARRAAERAGLPDRLPPRGLHLDGGRRGAPPAAVRGAGGRARAATRGWGSRTTSTCPRACSRRAASSWSRRPRSALRPGAARWRRRSRRASFFVSRSSRWLRAPSPSGRGPG